MLDAILWDYDGTIADTPVKNLAVTKAVLFRLDPALLDPVPEALDRLGPVPMGICSQNDPDNIRAALAAHGVGSRFAAVVGHADVPFDCQKPHPAAFLTCLDRLGLRAGRFAYVGDHAADAAFGWNAQAALEAMGRKASVFCVLAAWGGGPEPDGAGADAVVRTPAELADLLLRL